MRLLFGSVVAALVVACFNVTPDPIAQTPPTVKAPALACTEASDASVDASAYADSGFIILDAGPPQPPCPAPPSVCADTHWLAYWEEAQCVNATCQYATQYRLCDHGCNGNGCTQIFTAAGGGGL